MPEEAGGAGGATGGAGGGGAGASWAGGGEAGAGAVAGFWNLSKGLVVISSSSGYDALALGFGKPAWELTHE